MRLSQVMLVASALGACTGTELDEADSSALRERVIYGRDDRVEALDYPDARLVATVTERVGALLPRVAVTRESDGWLLRGPTLQEEVPLCAGEPLAEQPRFAVCTASLVEPDVIMTAGHCLSPELARDLVFVRGYYFRPGFPRVGLDDVQELGELLFRSEADLASLSSPDLAFARLQTAPPLPTLPLRRRDGEPVLGEPVIVAGTSEGLPLKLDGAGAVLALRSSGYFELTSDTFGGSSGSPVFARDGQLLGMLVGGAADYDWDATLSCYRRVVIDSAVARGEVAIGTAVLQRERDRPLTAEETPSCAVAAIGRRGALSGSLAGYLVLAATLRLWARRGR